MVFESVVQKRMTSPTDNIIMIRTIVENRDVFMSLSFFRFPQAGDQGRMLLRLLSGVADKSIPATVRDIVNPHH